MRKKILFVSERVTLAQLVRLVSLARSLDQRAYEVHLASARFDDLALKGTDFIRHKIESVSPEHVESALRKGRRLYDLGVLRRYVKEELALFARTKPDVVVGDFRLSLAVSAPVAAIPYVALANAYWSPYAVREGFPLPDHPIVKLLGEARAAKHFPKAVPYVFAHFAKPVNDLRKAYGLAPVGGLLEVLTHADQVVYADTPAMVPLAGAPTTHEFIGPVLWSPEVALPSFWSEIDDARPSVYVTLGSSGNLTALPIVVEALSTLPVHVLVATAGRCRLPRFGGSVHVTDFLPGDLAARRSSLVVSNGGSSTGYQALSEGVPVLGIPSNLDQYLAMSAIERAGAGRSLRASTVSVAEVRRAASSLLASEPHRRAARRVKEDFGRWSYADRFRRTMARFAAGAALVAGSAHAQAPSLPVSNEIRFGAVVDEDKGHVICALFRKNGWLKEPVQWRQATIRNHEAECVFTSVAPDVYGISAFHDENDNQHLDTNFLGIPTESWCTSRGAKAYFGPPSFDDAKFRYAGGVMRHRADLR
jgi:UDP:flavonoid glycosyltransferase YjiC (YdhE family)